MGRLKVRRGTVTRTNVIRRWMERRRANRWKRSLIVLIIQGTVIVKELIALIIVNEGHESSPLITIKIVVHVSQKATSLIVFLMRINLAPLAMGAAILRPFTIRNVIEMVLNGIHDCELKTRVYLEKEVHEQKCEEM